MLIYALVLLAIAALVASDSSPSPEEAEAPCALVGKRAAEFAEKFPTFRPRVSAQLAFECLNSVPLGKEATLKWVESISYYIQWQSDPTYLANPPSDYHYPPHDIFASLSTVKENLQNDEYTSEYAFQRDLFEVFLRAHSGHFSFYPDALTKALGFTRRRQLISFSSDGKTLPQIYIYSDILSSPESASVVKKINDIDAATFLQQTLDVLSTNQDADAAYNTMFYQRGYTESNFNYGLFFNGVPAEFTYPGAATKFTFENGTIITIENEAYVANFTGVVDGPSFYKKFCTYTESSIASDTPAKIHAIAPRDLVGYPTPLNRTSDETISSYYLTGEGFDDVAVLRLVDFFPENIMEAQNFVETFVTNALAAGKKKVVIDLRNNGGGYILLAYDYFRRFFPQIIQEDYTRIRAHEDLLAGAHLYSDLSIDDYDPYTASKQAQFYNENNLNYRFDYNSRLQRFATFDDKFGPYYFNGDAYTNIIRWNNDELRLATYSEVGQRNSTAGYTANFTKPFAAENIILLYNGDCHSTCYTFSNFMKSAGVKSIVLGGRPKAGPMQAVGGVKGSENLYFDDVYESMHNASITGQGSPEQAALFEKYTQLAFKRTIYTSINFRDNILPEHLSDGLPSQFVVEDADCRLYYTLDMVLDITATLKAAANSAFNGVPCVAGAGITKRDDKLVKARLMSPEMAALDHKMRVDKLKRMDTLLKSGEKHWAAKFGRPVRHPQLFGDGQRN